MKKKMFMWFDSGRGPMKGPYYSGQVDKIGSRSCHSLEQLLSLDISETIKRRLSSAKPGTVVRVHRLHSNGDMMLKCITEAEVVRLRERDALCREVASVRRREESLSNEIDRIGRSLLGDALQSNY